MNKNWLSNGEIIKQYNCIWDTGSMETLISEKVINDLNPIKNGYVFINTIHGEKKSDKYILQLLLEDHSKSIKINSACFGKSREFDIIIGMDIIEYGLFVLDKGKFSFTIEQLK
ncbi:hypothetical protein [Trichloromonas sp.]|uniref:hypothetical protein n=1 Tax=Trichloromonas sp. TaxID=3069249 RepID=UPI002A38A538|nr:hypothetical protein [Trichloromonas sp.]